MIIDTDKFVQVYSNCFDNVVLKETIKELQSLKTCIGLVQLTLT